MEESIFLYFYQHLPSYINPVFFSIGDFSIRWYGIMYLISFLVVYFILRQRIKNGEAKYDVGLILDFLLVAIINALIGGRLVYVFFYDLSYYLDNPLEAFLPIKVMGTEIVVTGFYGMSFYGGLIGVIGAMFFWTKKNKIDFWQWADFIALAAPAGYFFGRIGNFLNGELFGRETSHWWGMYFYDGLLRHPSQLYEAFFEGLVIFLLLQFVQKIRKQEGSVALAYLGLYGFFRFWLEFLREPDPQIGLVFDFLTLGQIFSIIVVVAIAVIFYYHKYGNKKNIKTIIKRD